MVPRLRITVPSDLRISQMFVQAELSLGAHSQESIAHLPNSGTSRRRFVPVPQNDGRGTAGDQYELFAWGAKPERATAALICLVREFDGREDSAPIDRLNVASSTSETPFLTDRIAQFASYVPKSKSRYLERDFLAFVAPNPTLHKLAFELWKQGKSRIGDVILLSGPEVLAVTGATPKVVELLKERLALCGLRLGMKVAGWNALPPPSIGF